jgi:ADP-ribose pyrophosphatase
MDKTTKIAQVLQQAQRLFHGIRFDVYGVDVPSRSGQLFKREFVSHPGSVVILPLLDENRIVLIQNRRFAVHDILWELPAGTLEPHEHPLETASRELLEESGYAAQKIELLTDFYTSPGISNEIIYAYAAYDLIHKGQALEDSEDIQVTIVSWQNALDMIRKGEISDAKTMLTLLFYHQISMNAHKGR